MSSSFLVSVTSSRSAISDLGGFVHLVGVDHRRQHEGAVLGADGAEVLLRPHHEAGHAHLAALLHRLGEQGVGLGGRLVGRHVVRGVVEQRVDVDEVDELLDVDRAARSGSRDASSSSPTVT
jgi:hypothetical protein